MTTDEWDPTPGTREHCLQVSQLRRLGGGPGVRGDSRRGPGAAGRTGRGGHHAGDDRPASLLLRTGLPTSSAASTGPWRAWH
jgi:hypothetical protein